MEIKNALVLDGNEPLSKALSGVLDSGTAVIVSKNGRYYGIIDDRNFRFSGGNPKKVKCETAIVKPPVIMHDASLWERTDAFLMGHFKALPVVDEKKRPVGVITRAEILGELLALKLIPHLAVTELMSSPVYTIEEHSKVADAKSRMKKYNAKRLVVLRRGVPVGVFSTLDLTCIALRPWVKERMGSALPETLSPNDQPITKYYRRLGVATMDEKSTVDEAARLMIKKEISNVVVLSNSKPIGIISALDIFKWIKETAAEETMIEISGLDDETRRYYDDIKNTMVNAIKKFVSSYGIRKVHVHVKKTKSFYSLHIRIEGAQKFVLSSEGPSLEETLGMASSELKKILRRKKGVRRKGGLL